MAKITQVNTILGNGKIKGELVHDTEDDALLEQSDKELSADGLGHSGPSDG
jgi:hypothetical protein